VEERNKPSWNEEKRVEVVDNKENTIRGNDRFSTPISKPHKKTMSRIVETEYDFPTKTTRGHKLKLEECDETPTQITSRARATTISRIRTEEQSQDDFIAKNAKPDDRWVEKS